MATVVADSLTPSSGPASSRARADPTLRDLTRGAERFAEARIERILAIIVALGSAVMAVQSLLNALGVDVAGHGAATVWYRVLLVGAFASLVFMILALLAGLVTRVAAGVCAVMLPVVMALWPLAAPAMPPGPDTAQPWLWYLLNVATAAAAVGFRLSWQIAWVFLVPVVYLVARLGEDGASTTLLPRLVRDTAYAVILGGVIIALGWLLRSTARRTDHVRADAVASYAAAAEADAAESERVAVAALMHDSVLAALIAVERAETPRENALAVAMAREALTRLANAERDSGEGPDEPVPVRDLVTAIDGVLSDAGTGVRVVSSIDADAPMLPGRVVSALVLAATQAIANSLQHAQGVGLAVQVQMGSTALAVRVSDTGPGFDPDAVPEDRLGIRGSIVARTAAVGGRARVQTNAAGTTILLDWAGPR